MEFINEGNTLVLKEKNFEYRVVLEELLKKNGKDIIQVLENNKINLPRSLNCSALREVLNPQVVKARILDLSDEMLYRLRFYPSFSEFQLQSLFKAVCNNPEAFKNYRLALYDKLINNAQSLGINDDHIMMILILDDKEDDFDSFEDALFTVTRDFKNQFDGVEKTELKESLLKSATATDLRELGDKYGISIPKRLKRNEIEKIIMGELKKQDKLDDDLKERIKKMPVISLQRLAKNNNIRVSADLKKEDIIEYLFADLDSIEHKPMKNVNLLGCDDEFEFKPEYVDASIDNENKPKEEINNNLNAETATLLKSLVDEIHDAKATKEVVREVSVDNTETNELLKDLVSEIKSSRTTSEDNVVRETVVSSGVDEETKDLLKELIAEMRKQNERPLNVASAPQNQEAPEVNVNNTIDTDALVKALDRITVATTALKDANANAVLPQSQVVEVKMVKDEEAPEVIENIYPYDNFTNQINPLYDEKLANSIGEADHASISPDFIANELEVLPETKLDKKNKKLEDKLAKKQAKQEAKSLRKSEAKDAKSLKKAEAKEAKKNKKAIAAAEKLEKKNRKMKEKAMEKAIKTGKIGNIDKDDFDQYMRLKEYRLQAQEGKRKRHERRMRRFGIVIKTILIIALLLALTWLVFALLFAFDIALNIADSFKNMNIGGWNVYDGLFASIVEQLKALFQK